MGGGGPGGMGQSMRGPPGMMGQPMGGMREEPVQVRACVCARVVIVCWRVHCVAIRARYVKQSSHLCCACDRARGDRIARRPRARRHDGSAGAWSDGHERAWRRLWRRRLRCARVWATNVRVIVRARVCVSHRSRRRRWRAQLCATVGQIWRYAWQCLSNACHDRDLTVRFVGRPRWPWRLCWQRRSCQQLWRRRRRRRRWWWWWSERVQRRQQRRAAGLWRAGRGRECVWRRTGWGWRACQQLRWWRRCAAWIRWRRAWIPRRARRARWRRTAGAVWRARAGAIADAGHGIAEVGVVSFAVCCGV
jgi:hypothetical protein